MRVLGKYVTIINILGYYCESIHQKFYLVLEMFQNWTCPPDTPVPLTKKSYEHFGPLLIKTSKN